jgi:hypothetical protein
MTPPAQLAPLLLSTACGILMTAATGAAAHGVAFIAATLAVLAVVAGTLFRPAATLAVVLTVITILLADPSPLLAALSGASATAYLVLRHGAGAPRGFVTATQPTMVAATSFTLAGLVATAFPLQLPWMPLLAPAMVLALYTLTTRPFMADRSPPVR